MAELKQPFAYVVAECRPITDQDQYTDIVINDGHYIFVSVEAAPDLPTAMYIAIDIERTQPTHAHITLHAESLSKLLDGIMGDAEPQPQREIFKLLEQAQAKGLKP